ncbi:MAG: hypothetical protein U9Q77_10125 [Candidatus Marinimicrobia bacterium]|nr:hypothetical protein [Candidatus Neomarinimicrobiota bacterium]
MRVKRSGRVVITTTLMILFYTGLVMWHNKPPVLDPVQIEQGQRLIHTYPELKGFLERLDLTGETAAFYSIGLPGQQAWPTSIGRACYHDPLAAHQQFSATRTAYENDIELIRYRSKNDFLGLLLTAELIAPGTVRDMDFRSHTLIMEKPVSISLGSIIALVIGVFGLLVVRKAQKDR